MKTARTLLALALMVLGTRSYGDIMNKKALIVVTSNDKLGTTGKKTGWYLSEVTHIYYHLADAGFSVDFASPKGGSAPMDESSRDLKDADNKKFLENKKLVEQISKTLKLSAINPGDYTVIHFAGGHGVMWDFADDKDISRITADIYERGGIVAAVCHGPAALVNVKLSNGKYLVEGKDINGFTDAEEKAVGNDKIVPFLLESKLKERGGKFYGGKNWEDKVVVADRLITGQNPQSAHSVGRKIVDVYQQISAKK